MSHSDTDTSSLSDPISDTSNHSSSGQKLLPTNSNSPSSGPIKKNEFGSLAFNLIDKIDRYRREKINEKANTNDKSLLSSSENDKTNSKLNTSSQKEATTLSPSPVANAASSFISNLAISFHKNVKL
jgi:hypothetical protein